MRRSVLTDLATLNRVRLNVEALIEDWQRLILTLHDYNGGYPTGVGGPHSTGHIDLSDRIACSCGEDTRCGHVFRPDPAERDLADLGRALQLLLNGATLARGVQTRNLQEPASANMCRGGACPAGNKAAPGKAGRCSACSRFWYESASDPARRQEREHVGQAKAA